MEESNEDARVVPELYFLIAKFLSGGPLKETAKTLLKELESVEVLPRRTDWLGAEHARPYGELAAQYDDVPWDRLAGVCRRALRLGPAECAEAGGLRARLSLLSEALVRPRPRYASHKPDHSLVRRLMGLELGSPKVGVGGAFPARALAGLQLQRRTLGHLSAVYCVALDRAGRCIVTGADDLLVKVWGARDGRLRCTLRGAAAEITDVSVSHDGALLAAGSVERLVRVWCLQTGAPRAVLHAHGGTITAVTWAPPARADLRWLASTSTDGSVAFWTCSPDGHFLSQPVQYVERMRPGACHMICAAWSAGGGFLSAGSADHHVRVYCVDGATPPRRVLEVAVHGDAVDSIAWAHRGLRFVSGSKDGCAALWTLHATQWRHVLLRCAPLDETGAGEGKRLKVTMVSWDCSDALVLTACSDWSVRVWCSRSARLVRALTGHRDEAYVLEAHPSLPGVLLSAGHDGQLLVWNAPTGEVITKFHNHIAGQGDGAIFDAKWGADGTTVAASDSHGHLLMLGLGAGSPLLRQLPQELFFHTDYRPLVRDALGGALDEQTETPPHLMAPPFLVDVEGAPHPPALQRLVPGRENLSFAQLIPAADAARNRIDVMIEALAAERTPPAALGALGLGGEGRGPWRGEGVRHTAGSWQTGEPAAPSTRPIVEPLSAAERARVEQTSAELNALEQAWYRREMRRRPLMISTATDGTAGPRRRPGRRPARAPPRPVPRAPVNRVRTPEPDMDLEMEIEGEGESGTEDTSDESVRLSGSERSGAARRARARAAAAAAARRTRRDHHDTTTDSDSSVSYSESRSSNSSDSSQYSDWEAGAALAPPARARRRPLPARRYSPSTATVKRGAAAVPPPPAATADPVVTNGDASPAPGPSQPAPPPELPEAFRPGEWLCAVAPRKAPYHPQMGDHCLYFRLGHQRYFEAVSEKDVYVVHPRDKPWERTHINDCEEVKVVGIKYAIKPPRVANVRVSSTRAGERRTFTVRYHDMPDVIDFLVLRQQFEAATARRWGAGDRFRCMIDDSWWTGVVLERAAPAVPSPDWGAAAAAHFLSLRVRWDNGEVERLSPWDLEPIDPDRLPAEPGGAVPVLPHELEAALYRAEPHEWPPRGDRAAACRSIAQHIGQVMSLSVAEPFVAPVDLQLYPSYAMVVPYPIDLATIRARFENLFYRRTAAAQFDVRYLASNAEQFNEPHSPIVRQARLVTDLLLHIISHWRDVDVVSKYHELAAAYHSSDDEPLAASLQGGARRGRRAGGARDAAWVAACERVLRELLASADAEPFRHPVSLQQAPDYHVVVSRPMDLGTAGRRLAGGEYADGAQFAADVRLVFANSRLYNTNKRSRIYSMTVRLSALFESLWSRLAPAEPRGARHARHVRHVGRDRHERHAGRSAGRPRRTRRALRPTRTEAMNGTSPPGEPAPGDGDAVRAGPSGGARLSGEAATRASDASSESEPLAATSRRVHAAHDAHAGHDSHDSWDSDAPLHTQRKGKGVGKKSKSSQEQTHETEPAPAAGRPRHDDEYVPEPEEVNGAASESDASAASASASAASEASGRIAVLEEVLEEDVHLTYESDSPPTQRARKRRRGARRHSASSAEWERDRRRAHRHRQRSSPRTKRIRERFTEGSSTGSSSESDGADVGGRGRVRAGGRGGADRYESDHSYRPRYSTDDDAPLNVYRQRHEGGEGGAGPSRRHPHETCAAEGAARGRRAGVSLRARRSPRRYNEDSEEDSIAAISKRGPHHLRHVHARVHAARRRLHHAARSALPLVLPAHGGDHTYFNGHALPPLPHHYSNGSGGSSSAAATSGATSGAGAGGGAGAVSISSRGRVRKLTAKARGLLRD